MLSKHSQDALKTLLRCSDDAFKMLSRLTQDALKRTSNHALKMLSSTLPSMLSSILPTTLDDILPASLTICLLVSCQDAPKYTLSTFPVDLLVSSEVYFWACFQVYSKLHLMTLPACITICSHESTQDASWEKLWHYSNADLLWPLVLYYDMILIILAWHRTLWVYYRELRDFVVHSLIFFLFTR